jgi:hypothetical protein
MSARLVQANKSIRVIEVANMAAVSAGFWALAILRKSINVGVTQLLPA